MEPKVEGWREAPAETPRERQVREELALLERTRTESVRQRRREAKCALVGHLLPLVTEDTQECLRCGRFQPEL